MAVPLLPEGATDSSKGDDLRVIFEDSPVVQIESLAPMELREDLSPHDPNSKRATVSFLSRSLSVHRCRKTGQKKRLHYLDWFRCLMVVGVVYAHTTLMGLDGGVQQDWQGVDIDDRSWQIDDPGSYGVRWISIIRPWCLPLLFWVSGASCACSFNGRLRGIDKLAIFTLVGVAANAALWYTGPLDKMCSPNNMQMDNCKDKGILFDFTVCPFAGREFAILFQMWYTVALIVMSVLNFPMFKVIHGSWDKWTLCVQWVMSVALYQCLIYVAVDMEQQKVLVILAVCEAIFLAIAPYAASPTEDFGPIPVRALQYILAVVILVQFGYTPYAEKVDTISSNFILFIFVGFNRFFGMGYIMIHADALPLCQRLWPAVVVGFAFIMPSTNFVLAGNLTYPFFPMAADRILYISFAVVILFSLQRHGHDMQCAALPASLNYASLVLYLFHPAIMTVLVELGFMHVSDIWLLSCVAAFTFTATLMWLIRMCCGQKKNR